MRLAVALLLLMSTAGAQELRTLARQKFDEGRVQFADGKYPEALALFKESYALAPYPDLLFNIGRCEEQVGHYREAVDAYERYLAVNPGDEEAHRRVEELRVKAAEQPVVVEPRPTPAPVVVVSLPPPSQPPPARVPVYRKWWLWTAVVGVAGVALGVGLGVGLSGNQPQRTFPPLTAQ